MFSLWNKRNQRKQFTFFNLFICKYIHSYEKQKSIPKESSLSIYYLPQSLIANRDFGKTLFSILWSAHFYTSWHSVMGCIIVNLYIHSKSRLNLDKNRTIPAYLLILSSWDIITWDNCMIFLQLFNLSTKFNCNLQNI